MKVRSILKRYTPDSNADVFLQTRDGEFCKLSKEEIRNQDSEILMNSTVTAIEVIDNVLTLYIR